MAATDTWLLCTETLVNFRRELVNSTVHKYIIVRTIRYVLSGANYPQHKYVDRC